MTLRARFEGEVSAQKLEGHVARGIGEAHEDEVEMRGCLTVGGKVSVEARESTFPAPGRPKRDDIPVEVRWGLLSAWCEGPSGRKSWS